MQKQEVQVILDQMEVEHYHMQMDRQMTQDKELAQLQVKPIVELSQTVPFHSQLVHLQVKVPQV